MNHSEIMPNSGPELTQETEKEKKQFPEIKFFGEDIDNTMINYAKSVIELTETFSNKSEFASIDDWQSRIKDLDSIRKRCHDEATEDFLSSKFFSSDINYIYEYMPYEDKKNLAREFVSNIKDLFITLITVQKDFAKVKSDHFALKEPNNESKIEAAIKELQKKGIELSHGPEDYKKILSRPYIEVGESIKLSENINNALKEYQEKNMNCERIASRYMLADSTEQDKYIQFLKNADRAKTIAHRNLAIALKKEGFLPEFDESKFLYEKWEDKQNNPIRKTAENFADTYIAFSDALAIIKK